MGREVGYPKVTDHMLLMGCSYSAHAIPHHAFSSYCWKQICHSKTAIKLTSCSLSDPLIKGRYPILRSSFGLWCILTAAMHHLDTGGVEMTGKESTYAAASQPCWGLVTVGARLDQLEGLFIKLLQDLYALCFFIVPLTLILTLTARVRSCGWSNLAFTFCEECRHCRLLCLLSFHPM